MNKIDAFFVAILISLLSACAAPQFLAKPSNGVVVMPDGKMASLSLQGLAISASKTNTPYGLSDKITTFRVTLINQTDTPIEFIPQIYLLFDQNNRQYLALTKPDLSEAAGVRNGGPHGAISWGFGFGTFRSHSMVGMQYYSNPYWMNDPYFPRQSYQGLLAKALPIHPITIFSHAMVDGNIYFAVSPSSLRTARLQISRLAQRPVEGSNPEEIPYIIEFTVIK